MLNSSKPPAGWIWKVLESSEEQVREMAVFSREDTTLMTLLLRKGGVQPLGIWERWCVCEAQLMVQVCHSPSCDAGALAVAWPGYFPAAQNSLVFLSGVQCSGTEESLLEATRLAVALPPQGFACVPPGTPPVAASESAGAWRLTCWGGLGTRAGSSILGLSVWLVPVGCAHEPGKNPVSLPAVSVTDNLTRESTLPAISPVGYSPCYLGSTVSSSTKQKQAALPSVSSLLVKGLKRKTVIHCQNNPPWEQTAPGWEQRSWEGA